VKLELQLKEKKAFIFILLRFGITGFMLKVKIPIFEDESLFADTRVMFK